MLRKRIRYVLVSFLTLSLLFTGQSLGYSNSNKPKPKSTPSPSPSTNIPKISIDYADTNVPQIQNLTSTAESIDGNFVVTLILDLRVKKNTVASIDIGLAQKTTAGAYIDPIFQAPCTPLNKFSARTLNAQGDLTALASRSLDVDWYKERYVLTNMSKLGTNSVPCLGDYLITSMSLIDSAKHTLNLTANVASTVPITQNRTSATPSPSPTRSAQPNQNIVRFNDVGIMRSNIWNSRLDVAPCTPGTNQLPSITTAVVNGRTTQVSRDPTIIPTDRIACSQVVGIDLTRPIFSIRNNPTDSTVMGIGTVSSLPLFDKTLVDSEEVELLKMQIAELKKKNKQLTKEISQLKSKNKVQTKVNPTPKPTARTNSSQNGSNSSQNNWGKSNGQQRQGGNWDSNNPTPVNPKRTPSPARS